MKLLNAKAMAKSPKDLTEWFREDSSRWHALSPVMQHRLRRQSPFYETPIKKVPGSRGGKRPGSGAPKGPRPSLQKQYAAIVKACRAGVSRGELATRHGVTVARISQIAAQNGIVTKRGRPRKK